MSFQEYFSNSKFSVFVNYISSFCVHRKKVASPEDIEYFECQYEMTLQLFDQCQLVERVIARGQPGDNQSGQPDYLCKWQGLPYSDCTWEDGELISRKFKDCIEKYHARAKSNRVPSRMCKVNGVIGENIGRKILNAPSS